VDPRAGLDDVEKRKFLTLPGLELPPLGRPARSQSLYRLYYPDSQIIIVKVLSNNPHVTRILGQSFIFLRIPLQEWTVYME
jgi:hypothetical protein